MTHYIPPLAPAADTPPRKALALFSGGLDSLLAVKWALMHDIKVEAVYFYTGFSQADLRTQVPTPRGKKLKPRVLPESLWDQVPVHILDVREEFTKSVLLHPRLGCGSGVNACRDCKVLMYRNAWALGQQLGASFLISGEVLGQRPLSQHLKIMRTMEQEAGIAGQVVRPLCGTLLPSTIAENMGWIDRSRLLDIRGKSRQTQLRWAREWQVEQFDTPAGGCFLTEKHFSTLARELKQSGMKELTSQDFLLLRLGYHFRLSPEVRLIIGRNHFENLFLKEEIRKLKRPSLGLELTDVASPFCIYQGPMDQPLLELAGQILSGYAGQPSPAAVQLSIDRTESRFFITKPALTKQQSSRYRIS